ARTRRACARDSASRPWRSSRCFHEGIEVALVEDEQPPGIGDAGRRRAREVVDQRELAEGVAGTKRAQQVFALGRYLDDLHRPLQDDEKCPSGITLVEDDLARVIDLLEEAGGEPPEETAREPGEEGSPREKGRASGQLGILCPPEPTREVL